MKTKIEIGMEEALNAGWAQFIREADPLGRIQPEQRGAFRALFNAGFVKGMRYGAKLPRKKRV